MSGLESGQVKVVPYDAPWPAKYAAEAGRLHAAAGALIEDIQHIGSTAIPSMSAKPIIDIALVVKDLSNVPALVPLLEGLGYVYRGLLFGTAGHHFFRKGDPREYFLHVFESGSALWRERIAFRDYLIGRPEVADRYRQLKEQLAARYADDRSGYTSAKAAFIEEVTRAAVNAERGGAADGARM
jgi:GrpB-like predicted nucleotidyltransferase (UPF0157 family)